MPDGSQKRRQSMRLKEFDYAQPGAYFVTIVSQDRACLFGEIVSGVMQLNCAGEEVQRCWSQLSRKFPTIENDQFVIMPNHIHGIINIKDDPVVQNNVD